MNPDYLRIIRKEAKLSARALSELTGGSISRNQIADFETRRVAHITLEGAKKIADLFGVNLGCLVEETLNPVAVGMAYRLKQEFDDELLQDLSVLLAESVKEAQW